jgi:lipopolysaccharide biosynthesis glycosyltransferase
MKNWKDWIPWSLRDPNHFLNAHGDGLLFRGIRNTAPIETHPHAAVRIHSIVPARNVHAFLLAAKSYLMHDADIAIYVHDDGTLRDSDHTLIRRHLPGVVILGRAEMDARFTKAMNDPFLSQVRGSYTSYLKLFDPTFLSEGQRIILLDTDTLFVKRPEAVIAWARAGGAAWYHSAPKGNMKRSTQQAVPVPPEKLHIQTLIMRDLDAINETLGSRYRIEQGFCAGFVGYDGDTLRFPELKRLLLELHKRFGERVFRWGAEQTIHGLMLCGQGAQCLPLEDYFVFTQHTAARADRATFIHFVGENRYHKMIYPRLARRVVRALRGRQPGGDIRP